MNAPHNRAPDPQTRTGALFYATLGGLIVTAVITMLHHIHIIWT